MEITVGVSEIIGGIVSIICLILSVSAKRLIEGYDKSFEKLESYIDEECKEKELMIENIKKDVEKHSRCLAVICADHKRNHGEEVNCHL